MSDGLTLVSALQPATRSFAQIGSHGRVRWPNGRSVQVTPWSPARNRATTGLRAS